MAFILSHLIDFLNILNGHGLFQEFKNPLKRKERKIYLHYFNDVASLMLVCSPVQRIPGVEHLVQISDFLNQKNPIRIYFCHCLTEKIKTINQLIEVVASSHSEHKAE